jgi:hypothetical protein
MWRRVHLVWTDVSEESIASIVRVEKSASEEPAWAGVCSHLLTRYVPPKRRFTRSTWRHIPEDGILHVQITDKLLSKSDNTTKKYEIRNCDHSVSAVSDHTPIIPHGNCISTLEMDAAHSSEISVNFYNITWRRRHIPKDGGSSLRVLLRLRIHHLQFYIRLFYWVVWRRDTYISQYIYIAFGW